MSPRCFSLSLRFTALAFAILAAASTGAPLLSAPAPSITYEAKPGPGEGRHLVFLTDPVPAAETKAKAKKKE